MAHNDAPKQSAYREPFLSNKANRKNQNLFHDYCDFACHTQDVAKIFFSNFLLNDH